MDTHKLSYRCCWTGSGQFGPGQVWPKDSSVLASGTAKQLAKNTGYAGVVCHGTWSAVRKVWPLSIAVKEACSALCAAVVETSVRLTELTERRRLPDRDTNTEPNEAFRLLATVVLMPTRSTLFELTPLSVMVLAKYTDPVGGCGASLTVVVPVVDDVVVPVVVVVVIVLVVVVAEAEGLVDVLEVEVVETVLPVVVLVDVDVDVVLVEVVMDVEGVVDVVELPPVALFVVVEVEVVLEEVGPEDVVVVALADAVEEVVVVLPVEILVVVVVEVEIVVVVVVVIVVVVVVVAGSSSSSRRSS